MGYLEFRPVLVLEGEDVQRLHHIAEEKCVPTLMSYQIRLVDGGQLDGYPCAGFHVFFCIVCWERNESIMIFFCVLKEYCNGLVYVGILLYRHFYY